ncbi:TIGR00282 family metallophosphoesterase [Brucepastera parasyntrophica]|uniref:TIGR00282 family metallophosphoesterase n=1 Tax=Brucepastera parasyntrophica TaxID=2880008 RepID=UPI003F6F38C7
MRILYVSEVVGKSGLWCIKKQLPSLKKEMKPDLVIVNGDGTTGSYGLGRQHAGYLRKLGADVITGGDCIFFKKDMVAEIDALPYVLRPVNYPPESPGRGWHFANAGGRKIAVVSMLGHAGFSRVHSENPFTSLNAVAARLSEETDFIIVDFHSGATAEKQAFFYHADGKVSAVIGSHARVQTADERILPGGCGVITDAGRTGSRNSVGGTAAEPKIREYLTCIPDWSKDAWEALQLQGVLLDLDDSGKTKAISRIGIECADPPQQEI